MGTGASGRMRGARVLFRHGCFCRRLRYLVDVSYDGKREAHTRKGVAVGKGQTSAGGRAAGPNKQGRGRRHAKIGQGRKGKGQ